MPPVCRDSWLGITTQAADAVAGKETDMLPLIFVIIVVVLLLFAVPAWPYSRGWGYYPGGTLFLILVILLILWLLGLI